LLRNTHTKPLPPTPFRSQFIAEKAKALTDIRKAIDSLAGPKVPLPFPDLARGCLEGLAGFSWPVSPMMPPDTVAHGLEACEFYHNKLRKWGKDNSKPEFGAFANAYRDALKAMGEWTKDNAKMGLPWNAKGGDVKDYKPIGGAAAATTTTAAAPTAASAPAPAPATAPAPAPAPTPAPATSGPSGAGGGAPPLAALFAQISSIDQSSGRTEGLRHVTKDMKASANKDAAPIAPKAPTPAATPAAPRAQAGGIKMGDAKVALTGLRWDISFITKESQKGEILKITEANMRQDLYIYGCK
jgi:hypothetical protein